MKTLKTLAFGVLTAVLTLSVIGQVISIGSSVFSILFFGCLLLGTTFLLVRSSLCSLQVYLLRQVYYLFASCYLV